MQIELPKPMLCKERLMNFCRNAVVTVCCSFCFSLCAYSQDEPLTKDTIIQMVNAGLPEDVIVSKIRSEANPPKLSTDDLVSLKSAGVSDGVIRAMVSPSLKADPAAASGPAYIAPADPDDPMGPHDPGIYMMVTTHEGKKKLVLIERAGSGREKTANIWGHAFSYGIAKAKIKAEIPGPRAAMRSTEAKPEFYMYFPPSGNLGAADTISSPAQFSLLRLEDKKDHRETTVEKVGFGSASAGNDEKKTFKFNTEKLRPYSYKVNPGASLKAGEYAFLAATGMGGSASAGAVVVFDFGVDLK
jgi:hypothetical protein